MIAVKIETASQLSTIRRNEPELFLTSTQFKKLVRFDGYEVMESPDLWADAVNTTFKLEGKMDKSDKRWLGITQV